MTDRRHLDGLTSTVDRAECGANLVDGLDPWLAFRAGRPTLAGAARRILVVDRAGYAGGKHISKEQAVMSLFSRTRNIVAAKADKALDSAENPNELLDYSYEQMLD